MATFEGASAAGGSVGGVAEVPAAAEVPMSLAGELDLSLETESTFFGGMEPNAANGRQPIVPMPVPPVPPSPDPAMSLPDSPEPLDGVGSGENTARASHEPSIMDQIVTDEAAEAAEVTEEAEVAEAAEAAKAAEAIETAEGEGEGERADTKYAAEGDAEYPVSTDFPDDGLQNDQGFSHHVDLPAGVGELDEFEATPSEHELADEGDHPAAHEEGVGTSDFVPSPAKATSVKLSMASVTGMKTKMRRASNQARSLHEILNPGKPTASHSPPAAVHEPRPAAAPIAVSKETVVREIVTVEQVASEEPAEQPFVAIKKPKKEPVRRKKGKTHTRPWATISSTEIQKAKLVEDALLDKQAIYNDDDSYDSPKPVINEDGEAETIIKKKPVAEIYNTFSTSRRIETLLAGTTLPLPDVEFEEAPLSP